MGGGYLKTGWFGDLSTSGQLSTWNPDTGAAVMGGNSAQMTVSATAAIAFAVARGDERRVQDFGVTVPAGAVNKTLM